MYRTKRKQISMLVHMILTCFLFNRGYGTCHDMHFLTLLLPLNEAVSLLGYRTAEGI